MAETMTSSFHDQFILNSELLRMVGDVNRGHQIRNPHSEALNKFEILLYQCSKGNCIHRLILSFGRLSLENLDLPFGSAQGGELVEPFGISIFGFINCRLTSPSAIYLTPAMRKLTL
jgi:hypothetical protein